MNTAEEIDVAAGTTARHDSRRTSVLRRVARDPRTLIGALAVILILVVVIIGPHLAPHDPGDFVGAPFAAAGHDALLGTDILGRDVWSRLLAGGLTFVVQGVVATVAGVGLGAVLGAVISLLSRRTGEFLLSINDTFIVIPQILVSLLIITRFGANPWVLVSVVAFSHIAHTTRVVRAATLRVVSQDYVRAAEGIGMSRAQIVAKELFPNVLPVLLVELGIRMAASFVLLASLNFLGFGSSGMEWGRMIEENKGGIAVQPWAVMAPVLAIAILLIGMNLVRDGISRAVSARSAR